jgi:hypothetical protein
MLVPPSQGTSPSDGLAQMLQAMTAEGALSSSGVFTIDVRAALPKLEKFQLPRPYFGLLKVIQSAVGSGASYVDTSFGSAGITIEHDGEPPDPEQLRDLLSYLLLTETSSGDRALRDLAIGVNTSLARGASWVEVSVRTAQGDWVSQRWASRHETTQSEPFRSGGKARVRFVVRRTLEQAAREVLGWGHKDVSGLLRASRDVLDEDARAVFDRCRNCPIPVRINGKAVPPSPIGREVIRYWSPFRLVRHRTAHAVEISLLCNEESPHLLSPPPASQARHRFVLGGHFDGQSFHPDGRLNHLPGRFAADRRCFGVLALRGRTRVAGELTVVKDGVDLTRLTPGNFPPGVSVMLTAEGLALDLSQFRLVDGEQNRRRMGWASELVQECARQLLADFEGLEWSREELEQLHSLAGQGPPATT